MVKPKILILGWARHGKDTVAEILRDRHGFKFQSSSYFLADICVRPYLAERGIVYDTLEQCYEDRVNHRAAWFDAIADWNAEDPAALTKGILEVADVYVGMRRAAELCGSRSLFDHVWWVDASGRGLPPEDPSSMDIEHDEEMTFINNNGSLVDLNYRVWEAIRDIYAQQWAHAKLSH